MLKRFLLLFLIFGSSFIPSFPALLKPEQSEHLSLQSIIQSLETVEIRKLAHATIEEIQSFLKKQNITLPQNPPSSAIFFQLSKIIEKAYNKKYVSIQEILGMCIYFEKAIIKTLEQSPTLEYPISIFPILIGAFIVSIKINTDDDFFNSDWITFSDITFWEMLLSKEELDLIKDKFNLDKRLDTILQSIRTSDEKLKALNIFLRSCKKNSIFINQIYTECSKKNHFCVFALSYILKPQTFLTLEEKYEILERFFHHEQNQAFTDHIYAIAIQNKQSLSFLEKIIFLQKYVYGEALFLIEQKFLNFMKFDLYIDPDKEFLPLSERILKLISESGN